MRKTLALLVTIWTVTSGCATTGQARLGIERTQSPAAIAAAATQKGALPAAVTVLRADGSMAPRAHLRATDGSERVTDIQADADGHTTVGIWSEAIGSWKWERSAGDWVAMAPCRFYPADGGAKGWRVVCSLPDGGGQ